MKLSAPIHVLKSQAKELKRSQGISLAEAYNKIAQREGYSSWSLLLSKSEVVLPRTSVEVLNYLNPGDLMLIAARPGHGKTKFADHLLFNAFCEGRKCFFFSLETERSRFQDTGGFRNNPRWNRDFSDEISAEYIIRTTSDVITEGSVIAIDYLQILDQKRTKPELQQQVKVLKNFAKEKKCIILFISQVDRSFEDKKKDWPTLEDIRLPNPLDLKLFNKTMFLHNGRRFFTTPAEFDIQSPF